MSTYKMGAFEALEWAWNLLRAQRVTGDVEDATNLIQEMLFTLGSGSHVDFQEKTSLLKGPQQG